VIYWKYPVFGVPHYHVLLSLTTI